MIVLYFIALLSLEPVQNPFEQWLLDSVGTNLRYFLVPLFPVLPNFDKDANEESNLVLK